MKFVSIKTMALYTNILLLLGVSATVAIYKIFDTKDYSGAFRMILFLLSGICWYFIGSMMRGNIDRDRRELDELQSNNTDEVNLKPASVAAQPAYLDPNHPRFSAKLAAAVRVWEAMEDETLLRGKSPYAAMENWLETNYETLGLTHKRDNLKNGYKAGDINKTAITETAKTSNWKPEGGPPTTPGN